ncbi:MAG: lantibiotic dehydratase [Myxococcota bacterium]
MTAPLLQQALHIASPNALQALGEESSDRKQQKKIERTLARYLSRMTWRCEPFGLFAGIGTGTISERTNLHPGKDLRLRRHTRLDTGLVADVAARLQSHPDVLRTLRYFPNSSVFRVAEGVRHLAARPTSRGRTFDLVALESSAPIVAALDFCRRGVPFAAVADYVATEFEAEHEEAIEFVESLIESQTLVSELEITLTGIEPTLALCAALTEHEIPVAAAVCEHLRAIHDAIESIDGTAVERITLDAQRTLEHRVRELAGPDYSGPLLQVDLHFEGATPTLGRDVVRQLRRVAEVLPWFGTRQRGAEAFATRFIERYGYAEVPLLEAADEDFGIGVATSQRSLSPLLGGIVFPIALAVDQPSTWAPRHEFLLERLSGALRRGEREITITAEDVEALSEVEDAPLPLPSALSVRATVVGSASQVESGKARVLVRGVEGPSGARLLGRFAHGDPKLADEVREHLRAEERLDPEAIFAEIVHLPEGRQGNVLLRPVLREHEIPYMARSGAPLDKQIPLDDLMVSVSGNSVVLRSRRLGKRIVPRLSTAHNYDNLRALPLYRLLAAIQDQGCEPRVKFEWGPLENSEFLPRVVYERAILKPMTWRVSGHRLSQWAALEGQALADHTAALRKELGLPRWVILASDVDDPLAVDLESPIMRESLAQILRRRTWARFTEMLPGPDELCSDGHVHEVVVPLVRDTPPREVPRVEPVESKLRYYPPGSEWLYARLVAGRGLLDDVLLEFLPVVSQVLGQQQADRWFFVRYNDPSWHLRLRLHGEPTRLWNEARPRLDEVAARLVANGTLSDFEYCTYDRELERYGGDATTEICEHIFNVDSTAMARIVAHVNDSGQADLRWHAGLVATDRMLDDLGFDRAGKIAVLQPLRDLMAREFQLEGARGRSLSKKYRKLRGTVEALVQDRNHSAALAPIHQILDQRSAALVPLGQHLRRAESTQPLDRVGCALLHMQLNRLFDSFQREHEMVLYDFLYRHHHSQSKRRTPGR